MATLTMAERGRLGGLATVARHGTAHMSEIGKRGFRRLCTHFPSNSRRHALRFLHNKGLVVARRDPNPPPGWRAKDDAAHAELAAMLGVK